MRKRKETKLWELEPHFDSRFGAGGRSPWLLLSINADHELLI